jgi:aspartate/tyrosine/aromatic aminotransferase
LANYLSFVGLPEFLGCLGSLVFGKGWDAGRIYAAQSLGGTGALRVGADFLAQEVGRRVYVPQPTWGNHRNIFERAGFGVESIPYYCEAKHGFDGEGYLARLGALEPKSIVVFHAACHNPTGSDPTFEEWKKISAICKERSLLPFFDFAYQGFGDGLEEDARVVRYFLEQGHEMLVAYSCSKNFSLYSQRIGALFVICKDGQARERVGSQVNRIIRAMYSNPPAHGARIVAEILTSGDLCAAWKKEVDLMRRRIVAAHKGLFDLLIAKSKSRDFSFLKGRKGMFTYLDLSKAEVQALIEQHGVYTLDNGRISVAGLTPANTPIVAEKIIAVCK